MYPSIFLVSTLFTFAVTAAPVTDPSPSRDQCGPKVQIPGDPIDTCHEQPTLLEAGASPGAYGITPIAGAGQSYNNVDCEPVIDELCKTMSAPNVTLGKWYFHTDHTSDIDTFGDCQMGFYLPALKDAAPKPATVGEDGNKGNQCKNILGAIRWAARHRSGYRTELKAETVNLVNPPVGVEGMWPLTEGDAEGTDGEAVNAGYPSYIWQYRAGMPQTPPPPPDPSTSEPGVGGFSGGSESVAGNQDASIPPELLPGEALDADGQLCDPNPGSPFQPCD